MIDPSHAGVKYAAFPAVAVPAWFEMPLTPECNSDEPGGRRMRQTERQLDVA